MFLFVQLCLCRSCALLNDAEWFVFVSVFVWAWTLMCLCGLVVHYCMLLYGVCLFVLFV